MTLRAKLLIGAASAAGAAVLVWQLAHWRTPIDARFITYAAIGLCSAALRLSLPGVAGALSVNFLFILFGIVELSLPETLTVACSITAMQCVMSRKRRLSAVQAVFKTGVVSLATVSSYSVFHSLPERSVDTVLRLGVAAITFFVFNTIPVAAVISTAERKPFRAVWHEGYFWSFPYHLMGAAVAALMSLANRYVGWQTALLVIPVVYLIYRSYGLYLARLEDEKVHADEMAALHLRTIEALALAIEAKDQNSSTHLDRVQSFSIEIAKEMGLEGEELEALRAASLLHDIGKLAVPEHIISKPGSLTTEELEKMKIHPVVGAEILERVQFPCPVVPIVRSHHERWDGKGYPDRLSGEAIPLGARILSAVDCLDALATDRQYRPALPLNEALAYVVSEAGRSFDPKVVEILERRCNELESKTKAVTGVGPLSTDLKISNGHAPAAGFEATAEATSGAGSSSPSDFLQSIAAARQEVQALFELAQDLGNSLSVDETLSVLATRLRRMIACDAIVIYLKRDSVLFPEYVAGEDFRLFASLEIPIGQGLSGWVAENRKPIVNGNPSVEPGYLNDPRKFSKLRSALSVPLEGLSGVLGVLTLYHGERDAFTRDHLRILLAISSKVALAVENALRYRQAEDSATIDYLTQLPNARSLFLHLDAEMARAKRSSLRVAILVCDLDGFKLVNDRYGHLEGNKLLRNVARGLREACREYDFVARMGGDEFVLVLPGVTDEILSQGCQRFREVVIEAGRQICGSEVLNISIGRALFPDDGEDAEQLLAEGDRRMYADKQQNKIRMAAARQSWDSYRATTVQ